MISKILLRTCHSVPLALALIAGAASAATTGTKEGASTTEQELVVLRIEGEVAPVKAMQWLVVCAPKEEALAAIKKSKFAVKGQAAAAGTYGEKTMVEVPFTARMFQVHNIVSTRACVPKLLELFKSDPFFNGKGMQETVLRKAT